MMILSKQVVSLRNAQGLIWLWCYNAAAPVVLDVRSQNWRVDGGIRLTFVLSSRRDFLSSFIIVYLEDC